MTVTEAELNAARVAYRRAAQALPTGANNADLCLWKALLAAAETRTAQGKTRAETGKIRGEKTEPEPQCGDSAAGLLTTPRSEPSGEEG